MSPTIAAVDAVVLARTAITAHLAGYVQQAIAGCKNIIKCCYHIIAARKSMQLKLKEIVT